MSAKKFIVLSFRICQLALEINLYSISALFLVTGLVSTESHWKKGVAYLSFGMVRLDVESGFANAHACLLGSRKKRRGLAPEEDLETE